MEDQNFNIVVVDDEEQITDLLQTYLVSLSGDYKVTTFNDPEEARAFLLKNQVDVLITDFKMPKYDGIQLIKLVPANATKILISGYVSEITENQLSELKARFFEKPVPLKEFSRQIHSAYSKKMAAS
jgi:DNA-binding NtrC family response regulator